jgi:hypothetical protein
VGKADSEKPPGKPDNAAGGACRAVFHLFILLFPVFNTFYPQRWGYSNTLYNTFIDIN